MRKILAAHVLIAAADPGNSVAPDQIKATYFDRGRTYKTRPVRPYPQVAIYKGSGDTNDAVNFKCGEPTW
jgi:hypothetical protein